MFVLKEGLHKTRARSQDTISLVRMLSIFSTVGKILAHHPYFFEIKSKILTPEIKIFMQWNVYLLIILMACPENENNHFKTNSRHKKIFEISCFLLSLNYELTAIH